MIQVNELRVGNWVEAVAAMGNYPMQMTLHNFVDVAEKPDCANPISLTPEILVKCGFEDVHKYSMGLVDYADSKHCVYGSANSYKFHPFCTQDEDCQIEIYYLHQLQNLYFALTGEELVVNETP